MKLQEKKFCHIIQEVVAKQSGYEEIVHKLTRIEKRVSVVEKQHKKNRKCKPPSHYFSVDQ